MDDFLELEDTEEYEIVKNLDSVYKNIEEKQNEWIKVCSLSCPEGCGSCCMHFEPDITEAEAMYLAYWLLKNQKEKAFSIADGVYRPSAKNAGEACILFDPDSPYHCTVYGGRCLVCRIFGYSGDSDKHGERRWKPCRFYPLEKLNSHKPPLFHKQYSLLELQSVFGALPPSMSDLMQQAIAIMPGAEGLTQPLRDVLPIAIQKLRFIMSLKESSFKNAS